MARSFNGTTDYMQRSQVITFAPQFTIEFWMRTTTTAANKFAFGADLGNAVGKVRLWLNSNQNGAHSVGQTLFSVHVGQSRNAAFSADIYDGEWHHILLERNGSSTAVYVDGDSQSLTVGANLLGAGPISLNTHFFAIGGQTEHNGSISGHFPGDLADFCIWNRLLSSAEKADRAAGIDIGPPDVCRYRMDRGAAEEIDLSTAGAPAWVFGAPTFTDNPSAVPPLADFRVEPDGLEVVCADQSLVGGSPIVSWEWDFGDGSGSTDRHPTHAFDEPGTYTVSLTVTDDDVRTSSHSRRITVYSPDWLAGFTRRQQIDLTPPNTTTLGDWVQFSTDEPQLASMPEGDGDIAVTVKATGERLPIHVLTRDGDEIRLSVALPSTATDEEPVECYLYVKQGGDPAWQPQVWGGNVPAPLDYGPHLKPETGTGTTFGSTVNNWVHPNVMRVSHLGAGDPGYWLRFLDGDEVASNEPTVTHIRIDTPYPNVDERYENPYLLYSTDDGATWHEWPGLSNPIDAWPGTDKWNSDPGLVILESGGLLACYREQDGNLSGAEASTLRQRVITSAEGHLAAASVGEEETPTHPEQDFVSPSIVRADGLLHCFVVTAFGSGAGDIRRWTSNDDGETWTDVGVVIPARGRRYWHGGVSTEKIGEYYYLLFSEGQNVAYVSPYSDFRLFRSRDLMQWEAASHHLIRKGRMGGVMQLGAYAGNVFALTDGTAAAYVSGLRGVTNYLAGRALIDPTLPQDISLDDAFARDLGSVPDYTSVSDRGIAVAVGEVESTEVGPDEFIATATDTSPAQSDSAAATLVVPPALSAVDDATPAQADSATATFATVQHAAAVTDATPVQSDAATGALSLPDHAATIDEANPAQTDAATALFATVTHSAAAADTTPAQTDAATVAHQTPEHAVAVSEATPAQIDALLARLAEVVFVASASDATPMQVDGAGGTHHPPAVAVVDDATPAQTDSAAATFGELVHLVTVSDETPGQFDSAEADFTAPVFSATVSDWSPAQVDMATATLIRPAVATVGDSQPMQTDAVSAHYREHAPVGPFRPILTITTIRPRLTVEDA